MSDICPHCNKRIRWNEGGTDDMPEACDSCWAAARIHPHCDLWEAPENKLSYIQFFSTKLKKTDNNSGIDL